MPRPWSRRRNARLSPSAVLHPLVAEEAEGRRVALVAPLGLASAFRALPPGHGVEGREAHPDAQARGLGADALDDRAQEAGAVLEAAAVAARPVVGREQLVAQVAVAVLHVHELEAGPLREDGGPHVVVGQAVEVLVGQDPHAAGEAPVQDRVGEGDERLRPVPGVRARVAARVRDLQAHHEVVRGALSEARLVSGDEVVAQARQGLPGRGADHELAGVRPAVVAHGGRLAAPDQLRAREAEVPPAAAGQLGRVAVGRAVPALHRQDAEAVARAQAVGLERAGEGGVGGRRERVVEGERDAARLEVPAEGLGGPEGRDAGPAWISHVVRSPVSVISADFELPSPVISGGLRVPSPSSRGTPSGRVPRDLPGPSSPGTTGAPRGDNARLPGLPG